MGEDDMAVVDSKIRVHGIDSLRLADTSIFPTISNGNLDSPTIIVAERAADLIRDNAMLEPSGAPVGPGRDRQTLQRSTMAVQEAAVDGRQPEE
jgi:choline dehydrogenase